MSPMISNSTALFALSFMAGLTMSTANAAQSTSPSYTGGSTTGQTTTVPNVSTTGQTTTVPNVSTTGQTTTVPNVSTQTPPSTSPEATGPSWSSPNWRPVSGYTGDQSVYYTSDSMHALNRLSFYEHSDDPNHINIWLEQLCYDQPCDPGPRTPELHVGSKDENQRTKEIIAAGDDHYITAIQVCTTDENDVRKRKIKGARIWTARLEPGGVVNRTNYDPIEFDRPNCNNHWRGKQLCLGNRIAVGLRAYYNDDSPQWNNRYYMTGLELQCAFVEG